MSYFPLADVDLMMNSRVFLFFRGSSVFLRVVRTLTRWFGKRSIHSMAVIRQRGEMGQNRTFGVLDPF